MAGEQPALPATAAAKPSRTSAGPTLWPSHLDSLAFFRRQEELTWDEFAADLRKETPPGTAAEVGTAVHWYLEHAPAGDRWWARKRPIWAGNGDRLQRIEMALEDEDVDPRWRDLPPVREERVRRHLPASAVASPNYDRVSARIDGRLADGVIVEYKTTGRIDLQRLADAWQWRAYLWLTGAECVEYRVLEIPPPRSGHIWRLREVAGMRVYRYAGLDAEVEAALRDLAVVLDRAWEGRRPSPSP